MTDVRELKAADERERTTAELKAGRAMQESRLPTERFQNDLHTAFSLDIAGRSVGCSELGSDLWGLNALDDGRVGVYIVGFAVALSIQV